jgi:ribosomal protein L13E
MGVGVGCVGEGLVGEGFVGEGFVGEGFERNGRSSGGRFPTGEREDPGTEICDAATLAMFLDMGRQQVERERRTDVFERWLKDLRSRNRVVQSYTP